MNKPIFCIIGKSGVGKSTYLCALMKHSKIKLLKAKELKYHTTRSKRDESEDSYKFTSYEQYKKDKVNSKDPIIEERHYSKFDEDVVYYTLKSDLEDDDCNILICAASVDQVLSYYDQLHNVFIINIEVDIKQRLNRLIKRCNSDNECYEVCRRTLEENQEYDKLYARKFGNNMIAIDNSDIPNMTEKDVIESNINDIIEYIAWCLKYNIDLSE